VSAVSLESVSADYGSATVLNDVSLAFSEGSIGAVLGPSGSGKTTLLRIVAGLHRPSTGSVRLGDRVVSDAELWMPPESRRVGLVPQRASLFPHLSVADNVAFGLPRRDKVGRRTRVSELLKLAGIEDLAGRYPHQLSGGQAQRVALLRALAPAPDVVLLDEPFSALDAGLRANLRDEVWRILRTTETTAILVTHDQDEALSFADQVTLLNDGSVVQSGTPQQIYHHPVNAWAATFIAQGVLLPGVSDGRIASTPWGFVSHSGGGVGNVWLLIRPEFVSLWARGDGVRGRVLARRFLGSHCAVTVEPVAGQVVGPAPLAAVVADGSAYDVGTIVGVEIAGPVPGFAAD